MNRIAAFSTYRAPQPGFKALNATPGFVARTYSTGIILSIPTDRDLRYPEIIIMERKLDRLHDFHLGQAMSFMLRAKHVLSTTSTFNPEAAVQQMRLALDEIKVNIEDYARTVEHIDQLTIDDQMFYNAELARKQTFFEAHGYAEQEYGT